MKKIASIFVMMIGMLASVNHSNAQSATLMALKAGDTVSTTASLDTVQKVITATGAYATLGIQVVTTKLSGTVVGKAYLYSSLDGSNYTLTDSSSAFANQTTNVAFFTKTSVPYTYYRVDVRAADGANSTQANRVRVYYVFREYK